MSRRPQVGQDISVGALEIRPKVLSSSRATLTSSTGSALREMRTVLPIPIESSAPIPAELFTVPANSVPDSVMPRCSG
ncbi:hypothetical protein D3C80_1777830 [compost metagenome]